MSIKYLIMFLSISSSFVFSQNENNSNLIKFTWLWAGDTLGVIDVPINYEINEWQYGEGIITTLSFKDSSNIILHFGMSIQLPLLDTLNYKVSDSSNIGNKKIRSGNDINNNLMWCEYNFDSIVNIAFTNVKECKYKLYKQSLDSFIYLRD